MVDEVELSPSDCSHVPDGGGMKFGFMMLMLMFAGAANAASVREQGGNVFYVGDDGASWQLTSQRSDSEPILSPDGQTVVFGRTTRQKAPDSEAMERELWISDFSGKQVRRLLATHYDEAYERSLTQLNNWKFSADGKQLYFLSAAWAVSNALHVLDMASGKEHYITDANDVLVVGKGKYANHLVVSKHKYFKEGGSSDYYWLITPEGKEIKKVGEDDEQAERFIKRQQGKRK
jgi:dipeptidyl aminopeptidase/acylaminoacyl peptidase